MTVATTLCGEEGYGDLSAESVVAIKELSKTFGSNLRTSIEYILKGERLNNLNQAKPVLSDISLELTKGEIFGLLGKNGAGKTTLIRILCGLIMPTGGSASICGYDINDSRAIKQVAGFSSGDERSFFLRLSGHENLSFFGRLYALSEDRLSLRIEELSELLGFTSYLNKPMNQLSAGMKQTFSLARSLLHDPAVLFLDEPGKSLDPGAKERLQMQLKELSRDYGKTLFVVTHDSKIAEDLCDRLAVLKQGCIVECGDTKDIVNKGEWWNELFSL